MTYLEIIDSAREFLKDELDSSRTFPDNSSTTLKDTEMLKWVNWAQRERQGDLVQTYEMWFVTSTSIDLVKDQEEYLMPTDCLKVIRLENIEDTSSPQEIFPISFNDKENYYDTIYRNISNAGEPGAYAIKGNSFIFRPRPGRAAASGVRVYYSKRAEWVNCSTLCSILPEEYHELLIWDVVSKGLIKLEATPEALTVAISEKRRLERKLITTGENRQVQTPRTVKRVRRRT